MKKQGPGVKEKKPKEQKKETPLDRLKMEVAGELGLADKVGKLGWGGLTAAESGRVGGVMTRRLKEQQQNGGIAEG